MAIVAASLANTIQGTGINTPPAVLVNTLNAMTDKYILPVLADNVFVPSPTFWALMREAQYFGGGELVYSLISQEELTGGAYYGDQLLQTSVIDSIQPADQVWKHYYQSLSLPITDIILNRGGTSALDLIKSKFQVASGSFMQKLARALYHASPQNTTLDIDDLTAWVLSTTNTIAGINRSTNTFWQPQANFAAGGALTPTNAEKAYQQTVFGYDEPNLLLLKNTAYGNFKANFFTNIRFVNEFQDQEAVQMGYRYHFLFNNAVVVADLNIPNNANGWLLNTKYIYPVFHREDYFNVDPFIKPTNQRVVVSAMYLTWQLICLSPRMQLAFTGLA